MRRKERDSEHSRVIFKWGAVIVLVALGVLLGLAVFGLAGPAGGSAFSFLFGTLGIGAYLFPVLVLVTGIALARGSIPLSLLQSAGIILVALGVLAFLGIASTVWGGSLGAFMGHAVANLFGTIGALVLLIAVALVGIIIMADVDSLIAMASDLLERMRVAVGTVRLPSLYTRVLPEDDADTDDERDEDLPEEAAEEGMPGGEREPTVTMFNDGSGARRARGAIPNFDAEYSPPPLSILGEDRGKPGTGDIKANANIIKRTFQNFGIPVEMDEVSVGPTVTRYALKPAEGVRLSKIISLQNNLELALAAHPVRIEAPIPGKSLVGIEVPNASKATIGLGGILSFPEWSASKKALLAAVGRDITGTPHYVNISKMPHALVAGATGSGKSVAIHALITSLLYRNGPNQLRFIMVDPKRVELTAYNGIPHLLTPVITDPKKCILALKWAAKEMERRYDILETEQVRDIESYHKNVFEPLNARRSRASGNRSAEQNDIAEAMPYIIIVIDELADIMSSYPRELEAAIVRLAQMSRAVGIHLVLSTQRPSVNIITGLIKANVPTRMALQVASQIDSRTILDSGGAEHLLGAGDMLYLSADMQKPVRLQTAYISEQEVKKVVRYIKEHNAGDASSLDLGNPNAREPNDVVLFAGDDDAIDDDLYLAAKSAVEEAGRASTSYLQRKLRIGYSRAARLMDLLEEKGVIGPADGARPREILSAARSAEPAPQITEEETF